MKRAFLALPAIALAVAACSAGVPAEPPPPTTATSTTAVADGGFPITIAADNGDVTIESPPERILSLSPAATEILFAIGAGDQVAVVDSFSTYPPEAPTDPDLMAIEPNIEAIVAEHDPDLVVMFFDPGEVEASFEALGVPVIVQLAPTDLEGIYPQIEQIGTATGNVDGATSLVADMRARIDGLVAEHADTARGVTYYHELDDTLYTVTSTTFVGDVYGLLGMVNVADAADEDGSAFGYPQLSAEYLVDADPDLIFLADTVCCGQSAESVTERPGWDALSAVPDRVFELDDDVASRPGPRVVDFLAAVADAVASSEAGG
jgi:iron complex transport system substrate-binding protein